MPMVSHMVHTALLVIIRLCNDVFFLSLPTRHDTHTERVMCATHKEFVSYGNDLVQGKSFSFACTCGRVVYQKSCGISRNYVLIRYELHAFLRYFRFLSIHNARRYTETC